MLVFFSTTYPIGDYIMRRSYDPRGRLVLLGQDGSYKGHFLDFPAPELLNKDQKLTLDQVVFSFRTSITIKIGRAHV